MLKIIIGALVWQIITSLVCLFSKKNEETTAKAGMGIGYLVCVLGQLLTILLAKLLLVKMWFCVDSDICTSRYIPFWWVKHFRTKEETNGKYFTSTAGHYNKNVIPMNTLILKNITENFTVWHDCTQEVVWFASFLKLDSPLFKQFERKNKKF